MFKGFRRICYLQDSQHAAKLSKVITEIVAGTLLRAPGSWFPHSSVTPGSWISHLICTKLGNYKHIFKQFFLGRKPVVVRFLKGQEPKCFLLCISVLNLD